MLSLMKGLTDLPQLLVFVEWKSYENPSIFQFLLHCFDKMLSLFTENSSFRKWFHNSQGEQQAHASVQGKRDQKRFV